MHKIHKSTFRFFTRIFIIKTNNYKSKKNQKKNQNNFIEN